MVPPRPPPTTTLPVLLHEVRLAGVDDAAGIAAVHIAAWQVDHGLAGVGQDHVSGVLVEEVRCRRALP